MSYINDSLGGNERVHYIAHFHWIKYTLGYGILVVAILLSILSFDGSYPWIALVPIGVGLLIFVSVMLPIWTTEIGVTNQRVIYKQGFMQRETKEMQLQSVEEVSLDQGLLGRILGYGKLQIHGTGDDEIYLPSIGDPVGMRRALQEALGNAQNVPVTGPVVAPQGA